MRQGRLFVEVKRGRGMYSPDMHTVMFLHLAYANEWKVRLLQLQLQQQLCLTAKLKASIAEGCINYCCTTQIQKQPPNHGTPYNSSDAAADALQAFVFVSV